MGIKRLFSLFSPLFEPTSIETLKDSRIGIDGMAWLYQSFFCNFDSSEDSYIGMLRQVEFKINLLRRYNIDVG